MYGPRMREGMAEQRMKELRMAIEKGSELQVENGPERRDAFERRGYLVAASTASIV